MKHMGELIAPPGVCRFCRCSEEDPCSFHRSEGPVWIAKARNCCNAPACIRARNEEHAARMRMESEWKRKRTPAEIGALIAEEQREKRRQYRLKAKSRKGRVA